MSYAPNDSNQGESAFCWFPVLGVATLCVSHMHDTGRVDGWCALVLSHRRTSRIRPGYLLTWDKRAKLPGVGLKTANSRRSFVFQRGLVCWFGSA
jgi:hypothetical protein